MLSYIAYCFSIFFIVLEVFILLYLIRGILPFGIIAVYFIDILVAPLIMPMQKIVKHSILNCFKVDISPYILLIVFSYLNSMCSYLSSL